jgi:asparaginyl-tRNA synthetase
MAVSSMPRRLTIARFIDLPELDSTVTISGTVDKISTEDSGSISSITIHDGSTIRPLTAHLGKSLHSLEGLTKWSTIQLQGDRVRGPDQNFEISVSDAKVLGQSDSTNPLNNGPSAILAHPHLRLRTSWQGFLMRFRSATVAAITDFFLNHPDGPFHQVHHPVITWTDCEGGAEVFPVLTQHTKKAPAMLRDEYFGGRRYLSVTAAIHGEAFAMGLDRIWMLAPSFRAERVIDDRHLAEFHMLEIAMNYVESLDPLLKLCENFACGLIERLRSSPVTEELFQNAGRSDTTPMSRSELESRWNLLCEPDWPRVTHAEAVALMLDAVSKGEVEFQQTPGPEIDFSTEHEIFILDHFQRPVFVTHYPTKIRLFSALQSPPPQEENGIQTTESVDLLLPGIAEVFSGGLREHRLDKLIQVMRQKDFFKESNAALGLEKGGDYPYLEEGESLDSLKWFADLRRYGTSPHGGFGIGFERLLVYLTGAQSTKDVIAFPRYYQSCEA